MKESSIIFCHKSYLSLVTSNDGTVRRLFVKTHNPMQSHPPYSFILFIILSPRENFNHPKTKLVVKFTTDNQSVESEMYQIPFYIFLVQ